MKTEQGCTSLPLFLSVSQQDEVMTEWQVYLGFPCLASRLSIAGFNVSGYHVDINGLEAVLAPAMPPSGAWWHLGEGGEGKGTDFYFSGPISPLPFIGFLCSVLLNPPVLAFHWHSSHLTWNIPWFFLPLSVSSRCMGTTSLYSTGSEHFLEPDLPGFQPWLCHFLAVRTWVSYLASCLPWVSSWGLEINMYGASGTKTGTDGCFQRSVHPLPAWY